MPVEALVNTTVPAVVEVDLTVTVIVWPAEMGKLLKSMAKLGNHSNQAWNDVRPPLTVKSTPACRMEFWAVSPSMPTQAEAAPVPEGVGTTKLPVTEVNLPEGGCSITAPDQLVDVSA